MRPILNKCCLLLAAWLLTGGTLAAQAFSPAPMGLADTALNAIFTRQGQYPTFPGGPAALVATAQRLVTYPPMAVQQNLQGTVLLHFTIDELGAATKAVVLQTAGSILDSACLHMLYSLPCWQPAMLNNKPVPMVMAWRITFKLSPPEEDLSALIAYAHPFKPFGGTSMCL